MGVAASREMPASAAASACVDSQVESSSKKHLFFSDPFCFLPVYVAVLAAAARPNCRNETNWFTCHGIYYTPSWLPPPFLIY